MAALKFTFDRGRQFRKEVGDWKKHIGDLRWAWPVVSKAVEKVQARNFDMEGAQSDMGGWVPLAAITAKARFFGWDIRGSHTGAYGSPSTEEAEGRILHWTHHLRDSLTKRKGTTDAVRDYRRRSMVFGTAAPHAQPLHTGTPENLGGIRSMPPRPILAVVASTPRITQAMQYALDGYFGRGVRTFAAAPRLLP